MSFYLKKLAEPEAFQEWREEFEKKNEHIFLALDDTMTGRKITGQKLNELHYFISRACFDAAHYKNIHQNLQENVKIAVESIKDKGKNPIKAIDELETFFKRNQEAAKIIAEYWFPEVFGSSPNPPKRLADKKPIEMLTYSLDRLKYSTELYAEKAKEGVYFQTKYGPLSFPRKEGQKRIKSHSKPEVDGLIFELALLIRCFLQNIPIGGPIHADIMEIPTGSRLNIGDEIVSRFVNAALNKKTTSKIIHDRLDDLKKSGAKWVDWETYYQSRP